MQPTKNSIKVRSQRGQLASQDSDDLFIASVAKDQFDNPFLLWRQLQVSRDFVPLFEWERQRRQANGHDDTPK